MFNVPKCRFIIGGLLLLSVSGIARAQMASTSPLGSPPSLGGTLGIGAPTQTPLIKGTQDSVAHVHLDAIGKPCLTVYGYSKQQLINPQIYEHTIFSSSNCAQPIKLKVCYYHSEQCVPINVPAYGHNEAILGIMPQMKDFRFEYWEQFGDLPGWGGVGYRAN